MLTTDGLTTFAMLRKVLASIGPPSGALLAAGTLIVGCAIDTGDKSRRDASTMPTASDATPISNP
jgi:hypothetical protein